MARHIMAVCVVCLLCADRLPCQQHVEGIFPTENEGERAGLEYQRLNAKVFQRIDFPQKPAVEQLVDDRQYARHRHKRHAGHAQDALAVPQRPEITENFLQRIFDEYGQEDGTIRITDFQRMLQRLGLHQLVQQKLSNDGIANDTCITDSTLVHHIQPHDLSHHNHHHKANVNCTQRTNNSDNTMPCTETHVEHDIDKHAHSREHSNNYTLSTNDVLNLCPVLLYQLASPLDIRRAGCIDDAVLADIDDHEATQFIAGKEDIFYVWTYAFISVFSCGLLGLLGMAIIPFMDSRYYKHIIQYLVALAVGTMTGDALLHLLPHSLAGQTEKNMIFKGLTCMGGIIFFYITEHGLTMISEWRRRIAKTEPSQPSRAKVVRDPESSVNNSIAGDKVCKSKYSSYPYCYDEITLETKNDLHLPSAKHKVHANNIAETHDIGNNVERKRNGKSDADGSEAVAQSLLPVWNAGEAFHNHQHHHHNEHQHLADSNTVATDLDGNAVGDGIAAVTAVNGHSNNTKEKLTNNDTVTVILREHESTHHGHSHKHGHVHSPPESLSAVAWMIIMGDGLHNFTDGMAIGAAFAENIAGGFSTSLAVFCHELPHELGDFAILIKAGMSVKSAVYYNLLTGVLSFIGMIFGIVFGQSPDAAQWMFAAASGLFIYISLVDMMPELSSAHKTVEQFVLQVFGLCTGVFIMLLIAIYEGDLMNVFSSSSTAAGHQHVH